jgi:hypothetical protein
MTDEKQEPCHPLNALIQLTKLTGPGCARRLVAKKPDGKILLCNKHLSEYVQGRGKPSATQARQDGEASSSAVRRLARLLT